MFLLTTYCEGSNMDDSITTVKVNGQAYEISPYVAKVLEDWVTRGDVDG